MGERRVYFKANGLELCGILAVPDHSSVALIVGVHGLMADKNSPKQIALAKHVASIKMAYFRFDHRGCGESEGAFNEQTTLENRRADLIAAIQAAREIVGHTIPVGLFGSSLGGAICLTVAKKIAPFALVTLAAPVQSQAIQLPLNSPDSLKNEIIDNRLRFDIKNEIHSPHHILIIHGSADETVPVENATTIYDLSTHPKKQIILQNGDHRVSNPAHQKRFLEKATNWFAICYKEQFQRH